MKGIPPKRQSWPDYEWATTIITGIFKCHYTVKIGERRGGERGLLLSLSVLERNASSTWEKKKIQEGRNDDDDGESH